MKINEWKPANLPDENQPTCRMKNSQLADFKLLICYIIINYYMIYYISEFLKKNVHYLRKMNEMMSVLKMTDLSILL